MATDEITPRAARGELSAWGEMRSRLDKSRDETVRRALVAGITKTEICALTGMSRSTIDRIAAPPRAPNPAAEAALGELRLRLAGNA